MKLSAACLAIAVLSAPMLPPLANAEDTNATTIKRKTWDLLRDIRACRPISKLYGQESWVAINSDYVQLQAPDRNKGPKADFAILYPLPRGEKTVTIEMELRWPTSEGEFQLIFDSTSPDIFSGTGVAFSFEGISGKCRPGTTVGRLNTFASALEKRDYETAPMWLDGSWRTLKIVIKSGSISCSVDGAKKIVWHGTFSPRFILLSGDQFWFIDIRKFNMRAEME